MTRRHILHVGALVWAVLGAAVALSSLGNVNDDARLLVGVASVVGPLLGVAAAGQLSRHADRTAGLLLVASAVLTPTYFAYAINLPALVVGIVLAVGPLTQWTGLQSRAAAALVIVSVLAAGLWAWGRELELLVALVVGAFVIALPLSTRISERSRHRGFALLGGAAGALSSLGLSVIEQVSNLLLVAVAAIVAATLGSVGGLLVAAMARAFQHHDRMARTVAAISVASATVFIVTL